MPHPGRPLSPARRRLIWGAAVLLLGGLVYALHPDDVTEVAVERLEPGPLSLVLALNGHVRPREEVALRTLVSAYVAQIHFAEGRAVRQGDLLVELDSRLPEARRDQARAALAVAQARENQARSAARRAAELRASVISRADAEAAELALATAEGESLRLTAALEEMERELGRYRLLAPIDGVVLERQVERGQLVSPEDSLAVIADPGDLIVQAEVDELYAQRIATGQQVQLRPVGETALHGGEITFTAPRLNPDSGGRRIEMAFATPVMLPVGLTVEANIIVESHAAALSVPRSALIARGRAWQVLVEEDGRARARDIRIVDWPAERVMVLEGLEPGARVLTSPGGLAPGAQIRAL